MVVWPIYRVTFICLREVAVLIGRATMALGVKRVLMVNIIPWVGII